MRGATASGGGSADPNAAAPAEREVLRRLKANTREEHDLIEQTRIMQALFADGFEREHYRMVLTALYGFYDPLEARLRSTPPAGVAIAPRLKTGNLAADLAELGCAKRQLPKLPRCRRLPAMADPVAALGVLYVLDGASMGGAVILKHLGSRLDEKTLRATRFYVGYGKQTAARWRSLQDAIVDACRNDGEAEARMTAAAVATFRAMRLWLDGHPLAEAAMPVSAEELELAEQTGPFSRYLSSDLTSQIGTSKRST